MTLFLYLNLYFHVLIRDIMYDPKSVAFQFENPFGKKESWGKPLLLTIWHCDPEKDGTDDSCGRIISGRHIPDEVLAKVQEEFEFNFKYNYWFKNDGYPVFSTMGTLLEMYSKAAWVIINHENGGKPNRRKHDKFMRKHLHQILSFAENPTDSLHGSINQLYGVEDYTYRCSHYVQVITADIYRKRRKWWQDPKWHIHHWEIQFHPYQNLKRRFWDKCSKCGKRGFKGSAIGNWSGSEIWHRECDGREEKLPQERIIRH